MALSDGKIVRELDVSASFTDSIHLDFVDSAQAIAEARKKGLAMKDQLMMMLQVMLKNTNNEGTYWNILGDTNSEMSMLIDAKTGEFYKESKFQ